MNKFDLSSSASVKFEFDGQDKSLLSSVTGTVTFIDNDKTDGVEQGFGPVSIGTLSASEFTTSDFGLPEATFSYTLGDALVAGGLSVDDITGGDRFVLGLTVTLTDGRSFGPGDANGNVSALGGFYSSPYTYTSIVVCPPQPGTWTVEMGDTYGDGWQTPGGNPLTFTLSDGTVIGASLCGTAPGCVDGGGVAPYVTPDFGTFTFEVPAGTSTMATYFPGDTWGEISFKIISPTGKVMADYATGEAPGGAISLPFCSDF
jgi:hypothetical protein